MNSERSFLGLSSDRRVRPAQRSKDWAEGTLSLRSSGPRRRVDSRVDSDVSGGGRQKKNSACIFAISGTNASLISPSSSGTSAVLIDDGRPTRVPCYLERSLFVHFRLGAVV